MDAKNSIHVSFSLYDYNGKKLPHPRDIKEPKNVKKSAWIPQSMTDSIWILYEFNTPDDKEQFLRDMTPEFEKAKVCVNRPQEFYDQWVKE